MKFLEKYWWVILILVIVAVVLYLYFSKKETTTTITTTNPCAASNFATKIKAMEDVIDGNATWKAAVEANVLDANSGCFGKTYAACRKSNAIYQLITNGEIPSTCEGKVV